MDERVRIDPMDPNTSQEFFSTQFQFDIDFKDVKGQEKIKRALEITAAGVTMPY